MFAFPVIQIIASSVYLHYHTKLNCHCRVIDVCLVAVYLEKVHRPGNKAVLVHCIELPEFAKARMFITYFIMYHIFGVDFLLLFMGLLMFFFVISVY